MAKDWAEWSYSEWNGVLLSYFLGRTANRAKVRRVPASPEELGAVCGVRAEAAATVTDAFINCIRNELPHGTAFCSYCKGTKDWTPDSKDSPRFFAMLWFTCLVAAGYGDEHGSFDERFHALLGKRTPYACVDDLWEDLASWTANHPKFAELELPPSDDYRVRIGRSYYLAFPNRKDRGILADVLQTNGMVGFEPPILPVIRAVERARERFSVDFRGALDNFREGYLQRGRDPTESAFWRAIRMEALGEAPVDDQDASDEQNLTLVASWDDDETLSVRVACNRTYVAEDCQIAALPVQVGPATHYLVDSTGDADPIVDKVLSGGSKASRGLHHLVRQGVLIFQEDLGGECCLVSGEAIDGAELALVRKDRVAAFKDAFGGVAEVSRYEGWMEVDGCECHQLSDLSPGLDGVIQLLHTSSAPRPRLVGGISVSGGYLWMPGFLPHFRSPTAIEVECRSRGGTKKCERNRDGDWVLPSTIQLNPPEEIEITSMFRVDFGGIEISRTSLKTCRFVDREPGCTYKTVSAGSYWREGCNTAQAIQNGNESVPFPLTTSNEASSADFLETDPSIRYLGPGLGQFSVEPREDFQWLATGPKSRPFSLVFIGDLDEPVLPDCTHSSRKSDCRAWAQSFTSGRTRSATALGEGAYSGPETEPRLEKILRVYQKRARRQLAVADPVECDPTPEVPWTEFGFGRTVQCARSTQRIVEALAAVGLSRSGLPLKELLGYFAQLTRDDFLLRQHVVRAWEEAGIIDLLRRQDRSQTMVVPRIPRFIMMRRGPCVDATLVGLAPSDLLDGIKSYCGTARLSWIRPSTPFQPPTLRLLNTEPKMLAEASGSLGLEPPQWLLWEDIGSPPAQLKVGDDLKGMTHGSPPEEYRFDAKWDWSYMVFRKDANAVQRELVEVERRRHPRRCSVYVVLLDGEAMVWTYIMSWALLRAAEWREDRPFRVSEGGLVESEGKSPIHLPLRFGRVCNVLGLGPSGPQIGQSRRVDRYCYPFGGHVWRLVRPAMPSMWFSEAEERN